MGLVGAALLVTTITACSDKATEQYKDAPRNGINKDPALIIEMPDGFSNLATKCIDGVRYTVLFHNNSKYGAVATVLDPACK